jgi:hypothetical protein
MVGDMEEGVLTVKALSKVLLGPSGGKHEFCDAGRESLPGPFSVDADRSILQP